MDSMGVNIVGDVSGECCHASCALKTHLTCSHPACAYNLSNQTLILSLLIFEYAENNCFVIFILFCNFPFSDNRQYHTFTQPDMKTLNSLAFQSFDFERT